MKISIVDLKAQHKKIEKLLVSKFKEIVKSSQFIFGKELENFESEFARYTGAKFAIGVASGTDALKLSLLAADIKPGDEVIIPTYTFAATAQAAAHIGARIKLVDCEPDTYQMNTSMLKKLLTRETKAIIPVHLFGHPCQMDEILSTNVVIIEDACQAHGALYRNRKVGSIGDLGCFSFYPSKNLGSLGDGGIVTTNAPELSDKLRLLRDHGQDYKYCSRIMGYNSRLDALQAAFLRIKLKYLDTWNKSRRKIAALYNKLLSGLPLILPAEKGWALHVYHLYVIQTDRRDELKSFLEKNGISTAVYYPVPVHLQDCFKNLGYKAGDFPVAEKLSQRILALPMHPMLTSAKVRFIARKISEFFNQRLPVRNARRTGRI